MAQISTPHGAVDNVFENEVKFVLDPKGKTLFQHLESHGFQLYELEQAYMKGGGRIRKSVSPDGTVTHEHNIKYDVPVQPPMPVEVESLIAPRAYALLLPLAKKALSKQRWKKRIGEVQWDIDLLYDENGPYISMAEAEMPEHMHKHVEWPPGLEESVIYTVQRGDKRFNNAALCEGDEVRKLLKQLKLKPKLPKEPVRSIEPLAAYHPCPSRASQCLD